MQTIKDLHYLSATEALLLFRTKELSPVELLEALIERSSVVEPRVNTFADTYYDEALTRARAAEGKYARGDTVRTLEGLPLAVRELVQELVAAHRSTRVLDQDRQQTQVARR